MGKETENHVGSYIRYIAHHHGLWQNRRLEQHGITVAQIRVLSLLWSRDGQTQKDIQERLCITPSSITGLINLLEEKGLLKRRPDAEDARVKRTWLTEAGRELMHVSLADLDELETKLTAGFLPEEKALLLAWLRRLKENIHQ